MSENHGLKPISGEEVFLQKALSLKTGEHFYFNMFQDGGAKIERGTVNTYTLYEIPLYGGVEREEGIYVRETLREAIQEALSWT